MRMPALLHKVAVLLCLLFSAPDVLAETPPGALLIAFHVYLPPPVKDYTISIYKDGLVVLDQRKDEKDRHFKPRVVKRRVDLVRLKELPFGEAPKEMQDARSLMERLANGPEPTR